MKLQRDLAIGQNIVTAVSDHYIDINGLRHESSLLLQPQHTKEWGTAGFDALDETDFASLANLDCDVLLIGTGQRQRFPQPNLLHSLMTARVGFEIMDTAAACRTYNILVMEGRNVAAALLIQPESPGYPTP